MSPSVSKTLSIEPIIEEFLARHRRGESPQVAEYVARFPEQASLIAELLPALAAMEQLKPASEPLPANSQTDCASQVAHLGRLGDYRIVREIGRGGMGIVYEAVQESLGRRVALKVLPHLPVDHSARQARFEREARAAARLHHTNIVPVFGVGSEEGLHYYAMQYIRGLGLDEVLQELRRQRADRSSSDRRLDTPSPLAGPAEPMPEEPLRRELNLSVTQALLEGRFVNSVATPAVAGPRDVTEDLPSSNIAAPVVAPSRADSVANADTSPEKLERTLHLSDSLSRFKEGSGGRNGIGRPNYVRSVAKIGVEVGHALQYAHEQGVLHRDIKPSNLLLDTSGAVWVTDFGLAKANDQQDLTQTGDVLGTLRYMAPEMYSGQSDRRSDVYSLGLTLYEMLVLRPAFDEADRGRLIRLVLYESPPRLRTIDPSIPADLETIIHKAIDREPGHRYGSAQELSEDLQRYLNNEPICARRVTPLMRFRRWCRRNPAVAGLTTTIASILVLAAIASVAVTAGLDWLVRDRGKALEDVKAAGLVLESEKHKAEDAKQEADDALAQERVLREEAEKQRDLAVANFARPRRAVDEYVRKISENELLLLPDYLPLRSDLLAEALDFYQEFTQEQADDPESQWELAKAHQRLAIIHRELGQVPAAQAANQEAIRRLESLRETPSRNEEWETSLADAYLFAGRAPDALALGNSSSSKVAPRTSLRRAFARAYEHLANAAQAKGQLLAAWDHYQSAADLRRQLALEQPDLADPHGELAATLHAMGMLRVRQKQTDEAIVLFQESLTQGTVAIRLTPHAIHWGRGVALAHGNLAALAHRAEKHVEALEHLRKMVEMRRRLVFRHPAVGLLRSELYQSWHLLAEQQRRLDQPVEARRSLRSAAQLIDQMPLGSPEDHFQRAVVHAALASPLDPAQLLLADEEKLSAPLLARLTEHREAALRFLKQAIDLGWTDAVALKNHRSLDCLRELPEFVQWSKEVESLGDTRQTLASKTETIKTETSKTEKEGEQPSHPENAIKVTRPLAADVATRLRHQRTIAATMHAIGVAQIGLEQFDAARDSLRQAAQIRQRHASENPTDVSAQFDALSTQTAQGELLWREGSFAEAHSLWKQCLVQSLVMAQEHREDAALQRQLADLEMSICEFYFAWGLAPEVQSLLERNIQFQRVIGWRGGGQTRLSDGDVARFVLAEPRPAWMNDYLRSLHAVCADKGEERWFDHANLLRVISLNKDNTLSPDHSVEVLKTYLAGQTDRAGGRWNWVEFALALADFRAGRLSDAQAWLEKKSSSNDPTIAYLDAAVSWKLGNTKRASERWGKAESLLKAQTVAALEGPPLRKPRDGLGDWVFGHAVRQFAAEIFSNNQVGAPSPWLHLVKSRQYGLLGEGPKADAELAAATNAAQYDGEFLIALARLQHTWGQVADGQRTWDLALALADNEPQALIKRGRWHAERGERALAEADYARAAALAPRQFQPFLATGWWVSGPFPAQIREFCPPELDPDPAVAILGFNPQTGLSDEPMFWRHVDATDYGQIDFSRVASSPGASTFYLLGHLYSPTETTATLCLATSKAVRIWVNGELLYHFEPPENPKYTVMLPVEFPLALRAGINSVMIKGAADANLAIRMADHPFDRAMALGRLGQWREAADLLEQEIPRMPVVLGELSYFYRTLALFRYADGDIAAVRRIYQELKASSPKPTPFHWRYEAVLIGSLAPEIADDPLELFQWVPEDRAAYEYWQRAIFLLAPLRAGRWQEVIDLLKADTELSLRIFGCKLMLAMSHHKLGQLNESMTALSQGCDIPTSLRFEWAGLEPSNHVYHALFLPREASRIVRGSTEDLESQFDEFYRKRREAHARFSPETAAFDAALEVFPNEPRLHLAYGRRLAELGRFVEAQAALDQAVKLAPQNGDILLARAQLRHELGDLESAADDFASAFGTLKTPRGMGSPIDYEIGKRPDIVRILQGREPANSEINYTRMVYHSRQFEWEQAREFLADKSSWGICRISLALWLGDGKLAQEIYDEFIQRDLIPYHKVLAMSLAPWRNVDHGELLDYARLSLTDKTSQKSRQCAMGFALYRAGDDTRSIEMLEVALSGAVRLQNRFYGWPILALAYHRSGNSAKARHYLNKAATLLRMSSRSRHLSHYAGEPSINMEDWFMALALYREAKQTIDGPEAFEEEVAELRDLPAYYPSVIPPVDQRYAAALDRAVTSAGDDPLPWIERARWRREQGLSDQADEDYAQAAVRTPQHLNRFLEAGWWVTGPYSANYDEVCPPELDANPAHSLPVMNRETKKQTEKAKWRRVASDKWGRVQVTASSAQQDNTSYYACADVYTATEQTRWLMVLKGKPLRIWLNGELVEDYRAAEYPIHPHYEQYHRVPVALRPGRNTLLVRTRDVEFTLRIGDTPRDRTVMLFEQERFTEAMDAFLELSMEDRNDTSVSFPRVCWALLPYAATDELWETSSAKLVDWATTAVTPQEGYAYYCAYLAAHRPSASFDQNRKKLMAIAESYLAATPDGWGFPKMYMALVAYRAQEYAKAREWLAQCSWREATGPLEALLELQAGNRVGAEQRLKEALDVCATREQELLKTERSQFKAKSLHWFYEWASFLVQLQEAELAIRGEASESLKWKRRSEEVAKQTWSLSPETAAFDQSLLLSAIDDTGKWRFPQPVIARGQRLAELGRWEAAEKDFETARKLAPEDPQVLGAYARFALTRGRGEEATSIHARLHGQEPDHPIGLLLTAERQNRLQRQWHCAAAKPLLPRVAQCEMRHEEGWLKLTTTGKSPRVTGVFWAPPGPKEALLCLRYQGRLEQARLHWSTPANPDESVACPLPDGEGRWQVVRIPFACNDDLLSLSFSPTNQVGFHFELAWVALAAPDPKPQP